MGKVSKPSDMTVVSVDNINEALGRVFNALAGNLETDNILDLNNVPVGLPTGMIIDHPTPSKPIYGDKFLVKKGNNPFTYSIPLLLSAMSQNHDYVILAGETSLSYKAGEAPTGITSSFTFKTGGPAYAKTKVDFTITQPYPSEYQIVIPKTSDIVPVDMEGNYQIYVSGSTNVDGYIFVNTGEPIVRAEEITFPLDTDWRFDFLNWDETKHVDIFIRVEILCEVLA